MHNLSHLHQRSITVTCGVISIQEILLHQPEILTSRIGLSLLFPKDTVFSRACKLALDRAVCTLQLLLSACGEDYHAGSERSVPEPLPCHPLVPTRFFQKKTQKHLTNQGSIQFLHEFCNFLTTCKLEKKLSWRLSLGS
jgi:hypothetical protein